MTILVATDFSENSKGAIRFGAKLAQDRKRSMVLIHIVDLAAGDNAWRVLVESPDDIEKSAMKQAYQNMESFFEDTVDEKDRPKAVRYEVSLGNPVDGLLAQANTLADPIIVAGTRGKSRFQEFFLGSTAHRLVRQTQCPVVLVPLKTKIKEAANILVAVDFSAASRKALREAAIIARENSADMHVVHGFLIPEVTALQASMASVTTELDEITQQKLAALHELVEKEGAEDVVANVEVRQMAAASAILMMADEVSADMIFMGTHGRRGWSKFFIGNTAERVMRRVPCPLYVVSAPEDEDK